MGKLAARLKELRDQRGFRLKSLKTSLDHSMEHGWDFASPNATLFMQLVQIEAQIRELEWEAKGHENDLQEPSSERGVRVRG